jgi:hypothetical protein
MVLVSFQILITGMMAVKDEIWNISYLNIGLIWF